MVYLKFHNTDHSDVTLDEGMTLIGSSADCHVILHGKGVAPRHCRIDVRDGKVSLKALDAEASCVLNGRQVEQASDLAPGDLLLFGQIGCQLVASRQSQQVTSRSRPNHRASASAPSKAAERTPAENATQVRGALPRLVLRGLSGPMLGRSFPLRDGMLLGRSRDCDVFIESQEISRQHARIRVRSDAVIVEDLTSTNGTFVNGERVNSRMITPGDELRLDTIRFVMVAPGSSATTEAAGDAEAAARKPWRAVLLVLALLALVLLAWWTWY